MCLLFNKILKFLKKKNGFYVSAFDHQYSVGTYNVEVTTMERL